VAGFVQFFNLTFVQKILQYANWRNLAFKNLLENNNFLYPHMKKPLLILTITTFLLHSCSPSQQQEKQTEETAVAAQAIEAVPDSIVEFLLESSVKDFRMVQKPLPEAFRNLSFGYLDGENQIRRFLMCGEFSYQNESGDMVWRHFATIQTSDYEQWVGDKQSDYCRDATPLRYEGGDLAAELLKRVRE
jgi:hypothetical protein